MFSPNFCGERCPEKSSREIPAKSSKICTTKILDTLLQRGWANTFELHYQSKEEQQQISPETSRHFSMVTSKHGFMQKFHSNSASLVIFFPLQKPLSPTPPRPHPTPRNGPETDLKWTRNGPETEPNGNGAKRSRNGAKPSRNGPKSSFSGWDGRGGLSG